MNAEASENPDPISEISPRELAQRLSRGDPLTLLDVREIAEREYARIPVPLTIEDQHIPMQEIPIRWREIQSTRKDPTLVVYCHHGVRSRMVAEWLAAQGLKGLMNLSGGIHRWSIEVDPTVPRY